MDGKENEAKEEREGKRKRERNESLVPAARDVNGEDGSRARASTAEFLISRKIESFSRSSYGPRPSLVPRSDKANKAARAAPQ